MKKEPQRRLHLLRIAQLLRDELRARGFNVLPGETAIVPVVIQQELDLCRLCKALLEEGIYINPVLRPAAAQNLLRISLHRGAHRKHWIAWSTPGTGRGRLGIERLTAIPAGDCRGGLQRIPVQKRLMPD